MQLGGLCVCEKVIIQEDMMLVMLEATSYPGNQHFVMAGEFQEQFD